MVNRTRCGPCQLADLARRAREMWAGKGKRCLDCEKRIDPSSKSVRCPVCQYIRESKSKRERRARVGREEKPKPPRYCGGLSDRSRRSHPIPTLPNLP